MIGHRGAGAMEIGEALDRSRNDGRRDSGWRRRRGFYDRCDGIRRCGNWLRILRLRFDTLARVLRHHWRTQKQAAQSSADQVPFHGPIPPDHRWINASVQKARGP